MIGAWLSRLLFGKYLSSKSRDRPAARGVWPLALFGNRTFVLLHRYDRLGSYAVTVTVRDDDGGVTVLTRAGSRGAASQPTDAWANAVFALCGQKPGHEGWLAG